MRKPTANMQTIELSDTDARAFLDFRRHQDNFTLIMASGIMDIREGSADIHFDGEGRIGAIKAHVNVYKRDPLSPVIVIHRIDNIASSSP